MRRAKVTCSIVTSGSECGADADSFSLDDKGAGDSFEDVRECQERSFKTDGQIGAAFIALDAPAVIERFAMRSIDSTEIAIRYNGVPASVTAAGMALGTIANGDAFTITPDQGAMVTVTFLTGDTNLALVIARINAAAGAIIAGADATGTLLKLTGSKTGGKDAADRTWQYGSLVLAGSALAKLGLTAGTYYGGGRDDSTDGRLFKDFPTSGPLKTTKIELSGSGRIKTHVAGRAA